MEIAQAPMLAVLHEVIVESFDCGLAICASSQ